jgi:hypothetical protein
MLRRLRNLLAVAVIAVAPVASVLMPGVVHALPGSYCQWTGTFNGDWDDEANWTSVSSGCTGTSVNNAGVATADPNTVPGTGDNLVFDTTASANDPVNNMSSMSFADVDFTGTGGSPVAVSGTAFTITGNISDDSDNFNSIDNDLVISGTTTVTLTSSSWLTLNGAISGAGSIVLSTTAPGELDLLGDVTMTGSIAVNGGVLLMIAQGSTDATVSSVTVASGATFVYDAFGYTSPAATYTLSTPIYSSGGTLDFQTSGGSGPFVLNLTGTITLTANTPIEVTTGTVVHVKGSLHGPGFKLTTANSGQVLNESTDNTSATPAGDINPAATTPTPAAPGTPDTGFALVSANPAVSLGVTVLAAVSIFAIARMTRKASVRR